MQLDITKFLQSFELIAMHVVETVMTMVFLVYLIFENVRTVRKLLSAERLQRKPRKLHLKNGSEVAIDTMDWISIVAAVKKVEATEDESAK